MIDISVEKCMTKDTETLRWIVFNTDKIGLNLSETPETYLHIKLPSGRELKFDSWDEFLYKLEDLLIYRDEMEKWLEARLVTGRIG